MSIFNCHGIVDISTLANATTVNICVCDSITDFSPLKQVPKLKVLYFPHTDDIERK